MAKEILSQNLNLGVEKMARKRNTTVENAIVPSNPVSKGNTNMTETLQAPEVQSTDPNANATEAAAKPVRKKRSAGPGRTAKLIYPGLQPDEKGNGTVKLKEGPSDFDATKHKPLKPTDFEDEAVFLDWRAESLEKRAAKMRRQAEQLRKFGSMEDRAKVKKLMDMKAKMAELAAQLAAEGINMEDIEPMEDTE